VPFLLADLRLADRSEVGEAGRALASPGDAWDELVTAVSSFAGGDGILLLAFTALAVAGLVALVRKEPAVAVLAVSFCAVPLLFVLIPAGSQPDLSPRHLFFGLPLWAAAIGVGTVWFPTRARPFVAGAMVLLALLAPPSALRDPRDLGLLPTRTSARIDGKPDDLVVPYSIPFLADLEGARAAVPLPQGSDDLIIDALDHAEPTIGRVFVALPKAEGWEVRRLDGPYDKAGAMFAIAEAFGTDTRHPAELDWWYLLVSREMCDALARLGPRCPS
jgi:hypothetical protein